MTVAVDGPQVLWVISAAVRLGYMVINLMRDQHTTADTTVVALTKPAIAVQYLFS